MRLCSHALQDVPEILPKVVLICVLNAMVINAVTSNDRYTNLFVAFYVLQSFVLLALTYMLHKSMWDHAAYMPLNACAFFLYGVIIGYNLQNNNVPEFVSIVISFLFFSLCFVGVVRRLAIQNTIASSEPIAALSSLETQSTTG